MRLLFVCTGNTCRSPMAEAVARALDPSLEVSSAGLAAAAGAPASAHALEAIQARGLDLEEHRSRPVSDALVANSELILVMTEAHRRELLRRYPQAAGKTFLLRDYASGQPLDVEDPYGGTPEAYRACLARLESELEVASARWATGVK